MKKLALALALVLSAGAAAANEGGAKPVLGLGALVSTGQGAIAVPINVGPALRIEPFAGYSRSKVTDGTDPAGDVIMTSSEFLLGAGVYALMEAAEHVELYAGGKVEVAFFSDKVQDKAAGTTVSDTTQGFGIAAVGGAEYYLSPRFALGVEAELGLQTRELATDVRETDIYTASFVTAKVFFK